MVASKYAKKDQIWPKIDIYSDLFDAPHYSTK